jgi:hypothetical protein
MNPVFDQRRQLQGQPGFHALIVGVSSYPFLPGRGAPDTEFSFGMRPLSSTSLAAWRIYRWLIDKKDLLSVPLATCRLLLSPSDLELEAQPELIDLALPANLNNFLQCAAAWRTDARTHPENATFFYFAGHGVQRSKDDAVLLLEEFGQGPGGYLRFGISINNLFNGMSPGPSQPNIARSQWYFADACRNLPAQFPNFEKLSTADVFNPDIYGRDDRRAPIFYAALPDTKAQGIKGEQTLFCKALLACLEGEAGEASGPDPGGQTQWQITLASLNAALERKLPVLAGNYKTEQDFTVGGWVRQMTLQRLETAPTVEVQLSVEPVVALSVTRIQLRDAQGRFVFNQVIDMTHHPYSLSLPGGIYTLEAKTRHPYRDYFLSCQIKPPSPQPWQVTVS